ncbi:MAG TPA: MATE family efflux transporter [Gemmatimonadaceae bacterium]|nr:MATE family efflux transporter [Gemmatimonadaceae bacterium]
MTTPRRPSLRPTAAELRETVRLAVPVIVVQVGLMLMGVVDTIMVGRVSAAALASVALGNLYFFVLTIFGIGVLLALDPVVSQAVGADDRAAVARALQRGLVIAVLVTVVVGLALLGAGPVLRAARQPAEVVPDAAAYALVSIPGVLPFFVFVVCRQTLQALRHMRPIVVSIVVSNLANGLLNWVLIYGHAGAPPMGAVGSGWASTISRWIGAVVLLAAAWRHLRALLLPLRREALARRPLWRMLRLGLPIGVQQQLEAAAFGVIGLLMGLFGTVEVAAHQVAINLASLTFMVPLAVGAAAAVTVGHAVGRGDGAAARRAAVAALLCGTGFMCLSAASFLLAPGALARLYSGDAAVVALASALIPIAGVFQVADGLQAVAAGVLRGAGDTRAPLVLNLLGFWLVGTPVSLYLAFRTSAGPRGLWWGLVAGLAAVAVLLLARMRRRLRGTPRRVVIDELGAHALPAVPE